MHFVKPLVRLAALIRRKDAAVFDPRTLRAVERAIDNAFPGAQAAQTVPVSRDVWELNTNLVSANAQSNLVAIDFPGPVDIVGVRVSLDVYGAEALPAPTTDDIRIQLRVNEQMYRTANRQVAGAGSTVPLSAFVSTSRIYCDRLRNGSPKVDAVFSWRRGANVKQSVNISLTFFTNPIEEPSS
jgi:hypothetical protein